MQIQKGLVKYKDRSDIVCTYGLTEDGKQYYFLDNTSISNGNIIASTVLVEAIDPVVVASSIGVIDASGNVVIPFENKSVKLITDNLLLVETANSTTPSVIEANSLRSDPLAATKLVTTPATIKDNMNAKMGGEGRFIFNDQFSEATICDINGNNIIDNQYFSFIAIKNNDTLYFSKNTVDSPVMEYSLTERMFIAPAVESAPLDVQNTEVTQETIDGAMSLEEKTGGFDMGDITAKDFEAVAVEDPLPVNPSVEVPTEESVVENDPLNIPEEVSEESPTEDNEEVVSVIPEEISNNDVANTDETIVQEQNIDEVVEIDDPLQIDQNIGENVSEDVSNEPTIPEENAEPVSSDEAIEEKEVVEETVSDDKLMSFDFGDDVNYSDNNITNNEEEMPVEEVVSEFKNDLFDVDLNSDIFADSTLQVDKIDINSSYNDFNYRFGNPKDTIIEDVATTMSNLIRLNKNQRQMISSYEEKMEQASIAYKKVVEKARSQVRDVESLKNKVKNYETIVNKLESKIQVLENKVHEQERIVSSQTRELEILRPQVEGKEELVKILADAQNLLDQAI